MEAHKHTRAANLAVSFRSIDTTNGVPTDSVEGRSEEEALSLTSTGLALTLTGLEVSLVRPGTAAYVEYETDTWHGPSGWWAEAGRGSGQPGARPGAESEGGLRRARGPKAEPS